MSYLNILPDIPLIFILNNLEISDIINLCTVNKYIYSNYKIVKNIILNKLHINNYFRDSDICRCYFTFGYLKKKIIKNLTDDDALIFVMLLIRENDVKHTTTLKNIIFEKCIENKDLSFEIIKYYMSFISLTPNCKKQTNLIILLIKLLIDNGDYIEKLTSILNVAYIQHTDRDLYSFCKKHNLSDRRYDRENSCIELILMGGKSKWLFNMTQNESFGIPTELQCSFVGILEYFMQSHYFNYGSHLECLKIILKIRALYSTEARNKLRNLCMMLFENNHSHKNILYQIICDNDKKILTM
jgi:hypothetical protein